MASEIAQSANNAFLLSAAKKSLPSISAMIFIQDSLDRETKAARWLDRALTR